MRGIRGIEDLGVFRVLGQPNLNLTVDRRQAARYQINVADVQDAVQTAVGGNALTQVLQGEARYDLVTALSAAVPRQKGSHPEYSPALTQRRAGFAGATLQNRGTRWGFGDLSRGEPAVYRGQVQRAWTRPGQRGGGSDP